MKYSLLFGKTRKNTPADTIAINHQYLIKGGFIDQLSAGIFTWMPLGLKVLRKVENIIRINLDKIGGQEIFMPTLISKNNWETGGRWDGIDILFKTKSQTDKEYGLGFSHEEVVTPLAGQYIFSYKDLPLALYQIQTKFRDELRAKSGILRGREFGMKDMYSFHTNESEFKIFYEQVIKTYLQIFASCGLNDIKITEASGGSFSKKHSHEFNVLTESGEVNLNYCDKCTFAQNTDITTTNSGDTCPECNQGLLISGKAIEVGNIFDLGQKFAQSFKVQFADHIGQKQFCTMGCYGIGTTRLVGAIVEKYHDAKGIIWPEVVAPFKYHLISLPGAEDFAAKIYAKLEAKNIEVLWDDRNVSAGVKFADCDLIGIPYRLVVSQKTAGKIEMKQRNDTTTTLVELADLH